MGARLEFYLGDMLVRELERAWTSRFSFENARFEPRYEFYLLFLGLQVLVTCKSGFKQLRRVAASVCCCLGYRENGFSLKQIFVSNLMRCMDPVYCFS